MPSRLREQSNFEPFEAGHVRLPSPSSALPPPHKKAKMSISQTYFIASTARSKLGKEAMRAEHNLRRLVAHANLLDTLMVELRDAEREQEAWFNRSVRGAQHDDDAASKAGRHIRWADDIVEDAVEEEEEEAEEGDDSDSDSDSDFNEDDFDIAVPVRRVRSPPVVVSSRRADDDGDDDEDMYEDLEDSPELALVRTASHPPELVDDTDSEDDSPPASPPQPLLDFEPTTPLLDIALEKKSQSSAILQQEFVLAAQQAQLIESY